MIDRIDSVYTAIRKNEKGFTFISIFLTVSIIFMTIPFTTYLTKTVDVSSNYDQLSVQQFFYFLRDEVIKASEITVEPSKITLLQPDESRVSLEQYEDLIVRQLDGEGFEVYLRNVQDVHFTPSEFGLLASITTINGDQFEKHIVFYN
ncbi:ComGF family competence protein [Lentibacillus sp.]|uniref:ComGF family competence protein n=1 Tax=Lentibacillus sp. TaxID=1925746 RepID=UPI002B4B87FA|nr:ComGF family competence protein [Lentibacillus sp.]HLS08040.1 ComGF family competence protein [Lentibacillus sp.]